MQQCGNVLLELLNLISGTSELPLFDFSLWDLVRLLGLDNLILLFISVLLEHQVLLYSSGKYTARKYLDTPVCEMRHQAMALSPYDICCWLAVNP